MPDRPADRPGNSPDAPIAVLVVDDDEMVLEFNALVLRRAGFDVTQVISGREALRVTQERPHHYQLLLVDLSMPEMSGEETLLAMRLLEPGLPVLVCTGLEAEARLMMMRETGRTGLLVKPYPASQLLDSVQALLKE